jgi:hypothetical protein
MPEQLHRTSIWVGIWQAAVGLLVGLIVSTFIFGRAAGDLRQKINDVSSWKAETMPRIEKMDRGGSISFENFKVHYDSEQAKQATNGLKGRRRKQNYIQIIGTTNRPFGKENRTRPMMQYTGTANE